MDNLVEALVQADQVYERAMELHRAAHSAVRRELRGGGGAWRWAGRPPPVSVSRFPGAAARDGCARPQTRSPRRARPRWRYQHRVGRGEHEDARRRQDGVSSLCRDSSAGLMRASSRADGAIVRSSRNRMARMPALCTLARRFSASSQLTRRSDGAGSSRFCSLPESRSSLAEHEAWRVEPRLEIDLAIVVVKEAQSNLAATLGTHQAVREQMR